MNVSQKSLLLITIFLFCCSLLSCSTKWSSQFPTSGTNPTSPSTGQVATYSPKKGAASHLYDEANRYLKQGNLVNAEITIERALRIEPRNGYYWYTLADIKFRKRNYSKTTHLCQKSKSLAGSDAQLHQLNDMLIELARSHP